MMTKGLLSTLLAAMIIMLTGCESKNENQNTPVQIQQPEPIVKSEYYCFIMNAFRDTSRAYIMFDTISFLDAEAMKKITNLKADKKRELPDGSAFINQTIEMIQRSVSDTSKIIMQTLSFGADGNFKSNERINLNRLLELYESKDRDHYQTLPFKVTQLGDTIIEIKEFYIP